MGPPPIFDLVRRAPSRRLAGMVRSLVFYRETAAGTFAQRETAPLAVPLIVSLGSPFLIALGRAPEGRDAQPSFVSGLHAGPVEIRSDGAAECVQADLTPLGAYRVLGPALAEITGRMVDIEELFGAAGRALRERLGATACWDRRFDLVEAFVAERARHSPSGEVGFAWRRLALAGGDLRIGALAGEIGWSRKHLAARFRAEVGLGPKAVARMMRFHRVCRLARSGSGGDWAGIAKESGYADQAHLARDFAELAGEPPTAWARRLSLLDARLLAPPGAG